MDRRLFIQGSAGAVFMGIGLGCGRLLDPTGDDTPMTVFTSQYRKDLEAAERYLQLARGLLEPYADDDPAIQEAAEAADSALEDIRFAVSVAEIPDPGPM